MFIPSLAAQNGKGTPMRVLFYFLTAFVYFTTRTWILAQCMVILVWRCQQNHIYKRLRWYPDSLLSTTVRGPVHGAAPMESNHTGNEFDFVLTQLHLVTTGKPLEALLPECLRECCRNLFTDPQNVWIGVKLLRPLSDSARVTIVPLFYDPDKNHTVHPEPGVWQLIIVSLDRWAARLQMVRTH